MRAPDDKHHDNQVRMAALEQRVTGIDDAVRQVGTAVTNLADKIDRRSGTNWPLICSAIGVGVAILTAIGGLVYRPIEAGLTKIEGRIDRFDERMVSRAEHEGRWRHQERDGELFRERLARVETRLDKRLWRLEERALARSARAD